MGHLCSILDPYYTEAESSIELEVNLLDMDTASEEAWRKRLHALHSIPDYCVRVVRREGLRSGKPIRLHLGYGFSYETNVVIVGRPK